MDKARLLRARDQKDLERIYPVMAELRTHLSLSDYLTIYKNAHFADGYEIVAIADDEEVYAVMGYRVLHDFVHGQHLYIDDLVTASAHRSKGLGARLLKHAESIAKESGCKSLRLCTGIENELGKKFYEDNGWHLRAVVFKKKLK